MINNLFELKNFVLPKRLFLILTRTEVKVEEEEEGGEKFRLVSFDLLE